MSEDASKKPLTPKEFGSLINRSAKWVRKEIRKRRLRTCPPHKPPYLIPRSTLFKFE